MLITFSRGISRIKCLSIILGQRVIYRIYIPFIFNYRGVVGWGQKSTTIKAKCFAKKKQLPYISLEDGFLRSVGLGVDGAVPHSLIVDFSGVYYDATRSSDLEKYIVELRLSKEERDRAQRCILLLKRYRLSKYNQAPEMTFAKTNEPRILVVDQTAGDASITYGLAGDQAFEKMLNQAKLDHPNAEILVKIHPDVIAGKKQGYLLELSRQYGCSLLTEACNPWSIFDIVSEVYVVTSQLGFEALLAGKKVHCFGMPFYAGWGLTCDQFVCERRVESRSLEEVFYAAYIQYCRYMNPSTGEMCQVEDTMLNLYSERLRVLDTAKGF